MKRPFGRKIRNLIAEFRGLPKEESISFSIKAKPISANISGLLKKIRLHHLRPEQIIQEHWAGIIPAALRHRCQPVKILNSDILVIHAESAVIRSELQLSKIQILHNLHALPNCAKIRDIRFVANR